MATSGSTDFSQSRDALILDAFQLLGVYGIGRTISSEDNAFAVSMLNKMIKAWGSQGLRLFTKSEAVLYITPNTAQYTLNNATTSAYCTNKSDEVMTQLSSALAINATSVSVTSTTNMTIGDYIGIVLDTKAIHWTTIATIPTSTTLTLTTGIVSSSATNNYVYTFTNRVYKPLRITAGRIVQGIDLGSTSSEFQIPLSSISYQDYYDLSDKGSGGLPNQYMYTPNTTTGTLVLWPRPTDGSMRFQFSYERVLEDLDNASDDFDFPVEWQEPLTLQLAVRLAPAFGKDQKVLSVISPLAQQALIALKSWDSEITSFSTVPDIGDY